MNRTRIDVEAGYSYKDAVWSGGKPTNEKLTVSLGTLLFRNLYSRRNEIFQIDPITKSQQLCGEIRDQAITFAVYLKQVKNLEVGNVIAICAHNDQYSIILILAAVFLGLPIICIDPTLDKDDIGQIIDTTKPILLISDKKFVNKFNDFENRIKYIIEKNENFGIHYLSSSQTGQDFLPESVDVTTAILMYMCSSGFTGPRRIVPYTHSFFYDSIYRMEYTATHNDIILSVLPLIHWSAIWSLIFCLIFGPTHIATEWSSSIYVIKLIQRYKVTCLNICSKNLTYMCLNPKLENYLQIKKLRFIWANGLPIPIAQMKFVRSKLECTHIVNCYICVEFGGYISHFDATYEYDINIIKINSVGRLRRGCQAMIVDITTRKPLGPNQNGELLVKTEYMPQVYTCLESKSDLTENGWFLTGDYAMFDDEQCLYVTCRIENLLHIESNLISPHDIEYIINRMPSVRDCVVIGIPDSTLGDLPVALAVKEPNAQVTEKKIIKTVALEGENCQRLRGGVYFIAELPSSVMGGILRNELRDMVRNLAPKKRCFCGA